MADRWFLAGAVGLAGFVGLEAAARRPGDAASLEATAQDRNTTRALAASYVAAAALVPLAGRLPGGDLPAVTGPAGLGLEIAGLAIRGWAMVTLGRAYSRTLRVSDGQPVIDDGPYRFVRHPGYLGSIATWTGFALTSRRGIAVAGVVVLFGRAYGRRMMAEEAMLAATLPGYVDYMERTWRMLPGIW